MKLTADNARQYEADSVAEAIGSGLEVNREFVRRYCSDDVFDILTPILDDDDALTRCLTESLGEAREWGHFSSDSSVILPVGEIEAQLRDGMSWDEYLDDPDDWTIHGGLAYLTMESVRVEVDTDRLRDLVAEAAGLPPHP